MNTNWTKQNMPRGQNFRLTKPRMRWMDNP